MTMTMTRRQALFVGAAAIGAAALGQSAAPAFAANNLDEIATKFTGGATPIEGKVKLDLPEIAELNRTLLGKSAAAGVNLEGLEPAAYEKHPSHGGDADACAVRSMADANTQEPRKRRGRFLAGRPVTISCPRWG